MQKVSKRVNFEIHPDSVRVKRNIINFSFFFDIFPVFGLEVNDGKVISAGTVKPVDSSSGIVQGISVDKNVSLTTKQSSGTTFWVEKPIKKQA